MRTITAAAICLCLIAAAKPPLNERVLMFCRNHAGDRVGDGQCSRLAEAAVSFAGARSWVGLTPRGSGDYVWGRLVCTLDPDHLKFDKVLPGDIVQLRDAHFQGADGSSLDAEHHTAVVKSVTDAEIVVWNQNHGGRMFVVETTYRVGDLKRGWLRVYRPFR